MFGSVAMVLAAVASGLCADTPSTGAKDSGTADKAAFRLEAEKGTMLPDANGAKAGPYDKIPGSSGGAILAFFRDGKGVQYGKVPAAKWLAISFATDNNGQNATVRFYDGKKHLGDRVENREFLRELLEAMYGELPAPRK